MMRMKIYVDVLWILNFVSDYMLLSATAFFLGQKTTVTRKAIAAGTGAVFAAFLFFLPLGMYFLLPLTVLTSAMMICIVFGLGTGRFFLRATLSFYLVSFATAGAAMGFFYLGSTSFAAKPGILYADIPAYTVLAAFLLSLGVIHFACGFIRKARIRSQYLYDITLEKDGRSITAKALYDTGNFLTEPLSQRSVLIAEWEAVSPLFDAETAAEAVASHPAEFLYIPYKAMGKNSGMFAFCPDRIISEDVALHDAAFVGIAEHTLDADGSYRMILPNSASISERM